MTVIQVKPYSRMDSILDMQRAIRMLRAKRDELRISEKIFVMGFSAGGMLSANCATHFDGGKREDSDIVERQSSRQDAGIPYELHIFQQGVHGMAMADGDNDLDLDIQHVARWGELCKEWLEFI